MTGFAARLLGLRRAVPAPGPHRAYTRKFDREVEADDLDRVLGPLSGAGRKARDEAWDAFETGLLAWRTRCGVAALDVAADIRGHLSAEELADTVVAVLVDHSGSMRGQPILLAAAAVAVALDTLRLLGCKVELLGFTTSRWRGGRSRARWRWRGSPRGPGRLCDLLHIVYRPDGRGPALRPMLRPGLHKENVDGEALDWAASRLARRAERRRVIVAVSDGAPVDDSTLDANGPDYLMDHLREVIGRLAGQPGLTLAAVGIGFDDGGLRLYPLRRTVRTPDDLGLDLMRAIRDALLAGRPRDAGGTGPPAMPGAMA